MNTTQDTIFALASAQGRAGVAVLRVSGPRAQESLQALSGRDVPASHAAKLWALRRPASAVIPTDREEVDGSEPVSDPSASLGMTRGKIIDQALVLFFESPRSYTGEDVVEYHLHGSPAVIEEMYDVLGSMPGHRLAWPGEFTRRAFENGKMDLTEAEAVADLINAETSAQKEQALQQMGGALATLYQGWTERLKNALAHLEADIEFPDEELEEGVILSESEGSQPGDGDSSAAPHNDMIGNGVSREIIGQVQSLLGDIAAHLDDNRRGEMLRDGIHVAVIGAPNAGKSSLVNALAQREVAIVSDMAGTTRDIIEAHLNIGGYPVILSDTAGLRPEQLGETDQDKVEALGIERALKRAEEADLKLLLLDGTQDAPDAHTMALADEAALIVVNKADQGVSSAYDGYLQISATSGVGLGDLSAQLHESVRLKIAPRGASGGTTLTRARHREALEEAKASLERALSADLPELTAEEMRLAIRAIGRITGRVDVEDLLDVIFNDFCIGK